MAVSETLFTALRAIESLEISDNPDILLQHGQDESYHPAHAPDLVVFPRTIPDVQAVVRACRETGTPIIPFGKGTSLEGHVMALEGGVSVDLSLMGEILAVNAADMDCRVQAGVTRKQLNAALASEGLFFSVDPGADATLGGMAATGASGTNTVRYGAMKENLLGLTVVMADGSVVETGGRSRKSASGYNLTSLFCGSEGTLGIIVELGLRLYGIPEQTGSAVCAFPSIADAVETVTQVIQMGIPIARIELLDDLQMKAVNDYSQLDYDPRPTLFFEFHGSKASVAEQAERVGAIAAELGGSAFQWATKQEDQTRLWQARHDAYYAARALRPGAGGWPTDVCVPITRMAECIAETKRDLEFTGMVAPVVGHVGDGNFHLLLLVDPARPAELQTAKEVNDRLVHRALAMGGTATGEHGIGYGKLDYMQAEHGEAVGVMAAIKRALDPDGILNPGKVIP